MKCTVMGIALAILTLGIASAQSRVPSANPLAWPEIHSSQKPWAYNWWLGSAVDRVNLSRELKRYRDGGLGGIHVIPIYGAQGAESRYLPFLSPAWLEMFQFAVEEAGRLGMGVDLTTGTGWCFGGPGLSREESNFYAMPRVVDVPAKQPLPWKITSPRRETIIFAMALGPAGERFELGEKVAPTGQVNWAPEQPGWKIVYLSGNPGSKVKRAAPGGEGPMLNTVSPAAMTRYLRRFSEAFDRPGQAKPRAMYHDSYEYYMGVPKDANGEWSPELFAEFARRRGYDLKTQFAALAGLGSPEIVGRVRSDYRETVSDIMIEQVFTQWTDWCRQRGMQTRNEAHGATCHVLDFYEISDIPETEYFGTHAPMDMRVASSAAHVSGNNLVSSETGTWLDEHFHETLDAVKRLVDQMFLSGVNHIFYHGCVYSPDDAAWPGWLFYAATQMNPRNPWWEHVPALNHYFARCQSFLQLGQPDNDLLVYYPIHDAWSKAETFCVRNPPPGTAEAAGAELLQQGLLFDYVSDRVLSRSRVEAGKIRTPGAAYRAVIVPKVRKIPLATMRQLHALAAAGATVIFIPELPDDVPGFHEFERQRAALRDLNQSLSWNDKSAQCRSARLGQGRVIVGELTSALKQAHLEGEPLVASGLKFIRRTQDGNPHYFLHNSTTQLIAGEIDFRTPASSLAVFDPLTGKSGLLPLIRISESLGRVFLRIEPGHSLVVRTIHGPPQAGPAFPTRSPGESLGELGPWHVEFLRGGPVLPKPWNTETLMSWTKNGDPATEAFSGAARYETTLAKPADPGPWLLDLGQVLHSARVFVNGRDLGIAFSPPYRLEIPSDGLKEGENRIAIEVINLGANRIRDLDRRGVRWKYFHDANVVSRSYGQFDASNWPVRDSGLIGPVRLLATRSLPPGS